MHLYALYINSITYLVSPTASIFIKQTNSSLRLQLGSPTSPPTSPKLFQTSWHPPLRPIRRSLLNPSPRSSSSPSSTEMTSRMSFIGVRSNTSSCASTKVRRRTRMRTTQKTTSPRRPLSHPKRRSHLLSLAIWRMSMASRSPSPNGTLLVSGPSSSGMDSPPPLQVDRRSTSKSETSSFCSWRRTIHGFVIARTIGRPTGFGPIITPIGTRPPPKGK